MLNILAIFIGGGLGSLSRYGIAVLLKAYSMDFPLATLSVNIIGSLILGFAVALFWNKAPMHNTLKLAITVGFCGGLTTFSTFSWETFDLIKNGEFLLAVLYAVISVLVCVLAISLGAFLSKYV
ncbi:MAG: fluoride efflux transporter CrcB [bacterium]